MIFKELLEYFNIRASFPDYLLEQTFNKVFLDGEISRIGNNYKISVTTRQNVTHNMFIKPAEAYPVTILSELPNDSLNGMKFGLTPDDVAYINKL